MAENNETKNSDVSKNAHISNEAMYQAAYNHYYRSTNYTWAVGGPLIAGVFVLWGLIFKTADTSVAQNLQLLFVCLVPFFSGIWLLFADMQRKEVLKAVIKLKSLEPANGFYKDLNSTKIKELKRLVEGKCLEMAIFFFLSFGGILGYLLSSKWELDCYLLIPLGIIIIVMIIILKNIQLRKKKLSD
jgi:uncharacterized membrane protein